ncbi:MAG: hypothetical protein M1820_008739 [Bogoriella megaspora]|nr:MAG: hypothetical protein M1820_008739 [Bogoriella megaspora]
MTAATTVSLGSFMVSSGTQIATFVPSNVRIYAPMVQMNWKASDLATTSAVVTTLSMEPTFPPSFPPGKFSSNPSKDVSPSSIVGIIIGGLAVIALSVAFYLVWRRRRHRKPPVINQNYHEKPELEANNFKVVRNKRYIPELSKINTVHEAEVPGGGLVRELAADTIEELPAPIFIHELGT